MVVTEPPTDTMPFLAAVHHLRTNCETNSSPTIWRIKKSPLEFCDKVSFGSGLMLVRATLPVTTIQFHTGLMPGSLPALARILPCAKATKTRCRKAV